MPAKELYTLNDEEFNLSRMFKETIIKASNLKCSAAKKAKLLGISERNMYHQMKKFNIKTEWTAK